MVPLFGAAYAAQKKAPHFYTYLGLQNTELNPLANGKIEGLYKAFECFSTTFQGKFYFQGLFRTVLYFQVLFKPVLTLIIEFIKLIAKKRLNFIFFSQLI